MSKTRPRLYCDETLHAGRMIALSEAQRNYLKNVLRFKEGDEVSLFNENQGEWAARITEFSKKSLSVTVQAQTRAAPASAGPRLILIPALIKRDPMDMLVEKAGELGVHVIQPVITARTNAHHTNIDRLQAIAMEASEQCDRLDIPSVNEPLSLARFLAGWPYDAPLIMAAEAGDSRPLAEIIGNLSPSLSSIGFLIGPEGGFTMEEHDMLRRQAFIKTARLGPRLLRAETAGISVLAAFQAIKGDWATT